MTGQLKYTSKKHNIDIKCQKGIIKYATYNGESLSNINNAKLVQPNEKGRESYNKNVASYVKEIKEDFAGWRKNDKEDPAYRDLVNDTLLVHHYHHN